MVKVKRRKQGQFSQVNQIEITRGFFHPLLPTPMARRLWEVTRGCRQGTIKGSRPQGLGGHTAGEDRSGITGATLPADYIVALLDQKRQAKKREEGREGV